MCGCVCFFFLFSLGGGGGGGGGLKMQVAGNAGFVIVTITYLLHSAESFLRS